MQRKQVSVLLVGALAIGAGVLWGCSQGPVGSASGAIKASDEAQGFGVGSYVLGEGDLIATLLGTNGQELGQIKIEHETKFGLDIVYAAADGTVDKAKVSNKTPDPARKLNHFLEDVTNVFTAARTDPALAERFAAHHLSFTSATDVTFVPSDLDPEYKQTCYSTGSEVVTLDPHCDMVSCVAATGNAADGYPKNGTYSVAKAGYTSGTCNLSNACVGFNSYSWLGSPYNICSCTGTRSQATLTLMCGVAFSTCTPETIERFSVVRNCADSVGGPDSCIESSHSAFTCVTPMNPSSTNHYQQYTYYPPPLNINIPQNNCPHTCPTGSVSWDYALVGTSNGGGCEPGTIDGSGYVSFSYSDGDGGPAGGHTVAPIAGTVSSGKCIYNGGHIGIQKYSPNPTLRAL